MIHKSLAELTNNSQVILSSPKRMGRLELIVIRPNENERRILETGELDINQGLIGDSWALRHRPGRSNEAPDTDRQITLMNARVIELIAGKDHKKWAKAGDQLFVDLDLSTDNLPIGTKLSIGDAILKVTQPPHRGCKKFATRFGVDAMRFVNSANGRKNNFRGINARVIKSGQIRPGDLIEILGSRTKSPDRKL
ncbi:MAG: hypothetical protein R3275_01445 [Saprospiraceae bacterium]|nr:hypothetical protein [Saprospiraceae bacterium]